MLGGCVEEWHIPGKTTSKWVHYKLKPQTTQWQSSQHQAVFMTFLGFRKLPHSCTEEMSSLTLVLQVRRPGYEAMYALVLYISTLFVVSEWSTSTQWEIITFFHLLQSLQQVHLKHGRQFFWWLEAFYLEWSSYLPYLHTVVISGIIVSWHLMS